MRDTLPTVASETMETMDRVTPAMGDHGPKRVPPVANRLTLLSEEGTPNGSLLVKNHRPEARDTHKAMGDHRPEARDTHRAQLAPIVLMGDHRPEARDINCAHDRRPCKSDTHPAPMAPIVLMIGDHKPRSA